jgi:hypothetical protein
MEITETNTAMLAELPSTPTGFVLWYRAGRGSKWQPVFHGETEYSCVCEMSTGCDGRYHGGHWLTLPAGQEP